MDIRLPLLEKVQVKQISSTTFVCAIVGKDMSKGDRLTIVYNGNTLLDKTWSAIAPEHSLTVKGAVLHNVRSLEGPVDFLITPEQTEGVTAIQYSYTLSL